MNGFLFGKTHLLHGASVTASTIISNNTPKPSLTNLVNNHNISATSIGVNANIGANGVKSSHKSRKHVDKDHNHKHKHMRRPRMPQDNSSGASSEESDNMMQQVDDIDQLQPGDETDRRLSDIISNDRSTECSNASRTNDLESSAQNLQHNNENEIENSTNLARATKSNNNGNNRLTIRTPKNDNNNNNNTDASELDDHIEDSRSRMELSLAVSMAARQGSANATTAPQLLSCGMRGRLICLCL